MQLHEKYRPKHWSEVVGQDKAVRQIRAVVDRAGAGGTAWWLSGPSGSGKTTLARLIAATVADPWCIAEYDSGDAFGVGELAETSAQLCYFGMGRGGRAVIINEAHGLRAPVIRGLLGLLERVPAHAVIVFTTTRDGADKLFEDQIDASPLLSRCQVVSLTNQGLARAFAERLKMAAEREGLDGQPIERYLKLMQRPDVRNNLRAAFQLVQAGAMIGGGE